MCSTVYASPLELPCELSHEWLYELYDKWQSLHTVDSCCGVCCPRQSGGLARFWCLGTLGTEGGCDRWPGSRPAAAVQHSRCRAGWGVGQGGKQQIQVWRRWRSSVWRRPGSAAAVHDPVSCSLLWAWPEAGTWVGPRVPVGGDALAHCLRCACLAAAGCAGHRPYCSAACTALWAAAWCQRSALCALLCRRNIRSQHPCAIASSAACPPFQAVCSCTPLAQHCP